MKKVFVSMTDSNIEKILKGVKTSTVRSKRSAEKINLKEDELGECIFKGKKFFIKNMGELTVDEAGGLEFVWETEGFLSDGPMFNQTKKWLTGQGKLYYYRILPFKF